MTRYEAAALVNACLDTVNDLIAQATADLVTQEDLAQLQRLQEEFREELAVLRARVDSLEAKVGELEANQFSTTTKLSGEVLFSFNDTFGFGDSDKLVNDNAVFGGRVRLDLNTSFTGSDLLRTRLEGENIDDFRLTLPTTRLEYQGHNGDSAATATGSEPVIALDQLWYRFSIGNGDVVVGPVGVEITDIIPSKAWGGGFFSDYMKTPGIFQNIGDEAGLGGNYDFNKHFNVAAAFISDEDADENGPGLGVFVNDWTGFAQLTGKFGKFDGYVAYAHDYDGEGNNFWDNSGTTWSANPFASTAASADTVGIGGRYKFSPRFIVEGFAAHSWVSEEDGTTLGTANSGVNAGTNDARSYTAGLGFVFPDLFREGNEGGIAVGVPPTVYDNDFRTAGRRREDSNTPIAIDLYYDFRISDNITITPGGILLFNANGGRASINDDTVFVGAIKTKFKF
jgi:hypothetical protein